MINSTFCWDLSGRQWTKYKAATSALFPATLDQEKPTVCFLGFRLAKAAGVEFSVWTGNDSQHSGIIAHVSVLGLLSLKQIITLAFSKKCF